MYEIQYDTKLRQKIGHSLDHMLELAHIHLLKDK